jgi:hypothetical protein
VETSRPASPERGVQLTEQFSDPPTTRRGGRVALQDLYHDGRGQARQLRDVVGTDRVIVPGGRRTDRVAGGSRGGAGRRLPGIAGLLSRPVRGSPAVPERIGPTRLRPRTPARRRPRLGGLIVRRFPFEDRQGGPGGRHRVAGDRAEFGPAEFDRRRVLRHTFHSWYGALP